MPYQLAVVGASWGGVQALKQLLSRLDPDLGLSVAITQHRGTDAPDDGLVPSLQRSSPLPVAEVEDKQEIQAGHVYVAPPDYHLLVEPGRFSLSVDDLVHQARPSIDVLFESAADGYRERVVGVVLTGASGDGAAGVRRIKERGGVTIVQDPDTADRREMPLAALATGAVDEVLPLDAIAGRLNALAGGRA